MKCFDCPYFSFGVNIKVYIRMWALGSYPIYLHSNYAAENAQ